MPEIIDLGFRWADLIWADLILVVILGIGAVGFLHYLDRRFGPDMERTDYAIGSRLITEVERLKALVVSLEKQVEQERNERVRLGEELNREKNERQSERAGLYKQIIEGNQRIQALELREEEAQRTIAELKRRDNAVSGKTVTVLGIWSGENIDGIKERNAIYNAGFEYIPLFGEEATRKRILEELRKGNITIIEIGAHGSPETIFIQGKELEPGWWQRALRKRGVQMAVVLACFSDSSTADAMLRAGVKHVVSVTGEIEDEAAITFAQQFYQLYAEGYEIEHAFDEAKLALEIDQAEQLKLRSTK